MSSQTTAIMLTERLRRYRGWTRGLVEATPDAWLYREVSWSECTIGWHMGHLAWKQDSYGLIYLGEPQQLDDSWKSRFYSEARLDIAAAPPVAELRTTFDAVFERFIKQFATVDDAGLTRSDPDWPDGSVLGAIANVIFHEGEHLAGIESLHWAFTTFEDNV